MADQVVHFRRSASSVLYEADSLCGEPIELSRLRYVPEWSPFPREVTCDACIGWMSSAELALRPPLAAWPAPYASNRLTTGVLPDPPDTWETIARELYKHLKALNELLYEDRYSERGPCPGCYDAQYSFEAFEKSPAARPAV